MPNAADRVNVASGGALLASLRSALSPRTVPLDLLAGLSVACVALPLNLALAVASGLPAAAGLIAGVVAGALAALVGGSRLLVTGPEAALVPVVLSIALRHGHAGVLVAGLLAGLLQIGFGALGLGAIVRRVPDAVVRGFAAGIGLILLSTQIPRCLGHAGGTWTATLDPGAALLAACAAAFTALLPLAHRRLPAALAGIGTATAIAVIWKLDVPVVGPLPTPRLPDYGTVDVAALLPSVGLLALVASLGSLISARAVDQQLGDPPHDSDRELVGQGLANIASSVLGGMPVMGAIVRSSVAIDNGARTRLASFGHAVVLWVAVAAGAGVISRVPIAALAGILVVVGVRLLDLGTLRRLLRTDRTALLVTLATALGIAAVGVLPGIAVGLVVSLVTWVWGRGNIEVEVGAGGLGEVSGPRAMPLANERPELRVVRLEGPLFFASQGQLESAIPGDPLPRHLVLDVTDVPWIDATGLRALSDLVDMLAVRECGVLVAGAGVSLAEWLHRGELVERLAGTRLFADVADARAWASASELARIQASSEQAA